MKTKKRILKEITRLQWELYHAKTDKERMAIRRAIQLYEKIVEDMESVGA